MKTGIIYKITNTHNGTLYIGQTTQSIEQRWAQHIRYARNANRNKNTAIARAIRKYGSNSFTIEIIVKDIPDYLLNPFEKYWIHYYDSFNNGYNCTIGGDGTIGTIPWNKGKNSCYSESTIDKMRQAKLGTTPSNLKQLQELAKLRNGVNHPNVKLANVYCYDTKQLIAEAVSLTKWCRDNGYNQGNLCATARGERASTKGIFAIYITGDPSS